MLWLFIKEKPEIVSYMIMTHIIQSTFITKLEHKFTFKIRNGLDLGHATMVHGTRYTVYLLCPK